MVAPVRTAGPAAELQRAGVRASRAERLARLRRADAIVRRLSHESGFDREVWQFPVILIPLGTPTAPDSVVLRPIDSVDGMTAQSVRHARGTAAKHGARVDGSAGSWRACSTI